MPNRIIRESALTSHSLAKLSDGAERLFWRLTIVADDKGRFDAYGVTVLSKCFPTLANKLSPLKIGKWLAELSRDHVEFYEVNGRQYGQFCKWAEYQRSYGLKSKFPEPPADCGEIPQSPALIRDPRIDIRESRIDIGAVRNRFEMEFWSPYPDRNGRKLYKGIALNYYTDLSDPDKQLIAVAVPRYAAYCRKENRLPKDPQRFIKGKDGEMWREWLEPEVRFTQAVSTTCTWPLKGKPCGAAGYPLCQKHHDEQRQVQEQKAKAMGAS